MNSTGKFNQTHEHATCMIGGVAYFLLKMPSSYQSEGGHRKKEFLHQKHSTILFLSKIQTNDITVEDKALTPPYPQQTLSSLCNGDIGYPPPRASKLGS